MINKFVQIKTFIFEYFGFNFLKKSFFIVIGAIGFFTLQKVNDFLSYRNTIIKNINTDYDNNAVYILSYNQILQNQNTTQ